MNLKVSKSTKATLICGLSLLFTLYATYLWGQQKYDSFYITNSIGEKLPLTTVINLQNRNVIKLDSNANVIYTEVDSFELRHIGYKSKKVRFPFDLTIVMDEINLHYNTVEITATKKENILGARINPNKQFIPISIHPDVDVACKIENNLTESIHITNICFTIKNESLINGVIDTYPYFDLIFIHDSVNYAIKTKLTKLVSHNMRISHTSRGIQEICLDVDSFNIILRAGERIYPGLKSEYLSGGKYSKVLKKDITLSKDLDIVNKNSDILWGSFICLKIVKKPSYYYLRHSLIGSEWNKVTDKYTPAFFITYRAVTD